MAGGVNMCFGKLHWFHKHYSELLSQSFVAVYSSNYPPTRVKWNLVRVRVSLFHSFLPWFDGFQCNFRNVYAYIYNIYAAGFQAIVIAEASGLFFHAV